MSKRINWRLLTDPNHPANRPDDRFRYLGAVVARAQDVQKHLHLEPTLMLPADFLPLVTQVGGYPVLRGDRFAVVVPI